MKIASSLYLALATVVATSALSASVSYAQSYPDDAQNCATMSGSNCAVKEDTTRHASGDNSAGSSHVHSTEHSSRTE